MPCELQDLGPLFRKKREEMHLTLKEVENATSIRKMYLQAIEEGAVERFLSPVYARGFVRQYANFLGFDGDKLLLEHSKSFLSSEMKKELLCGIGTLEMRDHTLKKAKKRGNLLWGGAFLLLLVFSWYLMRFFAIL